MILQRAAAIVAVVVVVGVVAAAFAVLGTHGNARAEALDRKRVFDLGLIAQRLHDDYGSAGQPLPLELPDSRRDPVSGKPYEYRRLDAARYVLCADFERSAGPASEGSNQIGTFWHHSAGRYCCRLDARRQSPLQPDVSF